MSFVSRAFASVHCILVITCWERADLLALVGDVYCIFVTFPCGILGQVWYLIVSFPDLCRLSYFTYRSALILFSLLNEMRKSAKYEALLSILSLFGNKFNKFNPTGARM